MSSDSSTGKSPPKKKNVKYEQKFVNSWLKDDRFKGWLKKSTKGETYFFCSACNCDRKCGIHELLRHKDSTKHAKNSLKLQKQQKLTSMFTSGSNSQDTKIAAKAGEVKMACFIAEHNLSFNIASHLNKLICAVCPDSKIAEQLSISRTKARAIIVNVTGQTAEENIIQMLQNNCFALLVDESTDKSTIKHLALVARIVKLDFSVEDRFLTLIPIVDGTATALYGKIVEYFVEKNIPYKSNMIGFASDGANVMFGDKHSLVTLFKNDIPYLFTMKCICHSFNLCASYACEKLPRGVEDFCRDVYNHVQNSPKRIGDFKTFQAFTNIKPHKLLHPCQTRWLSLIEVVNRLLEQLPAIKLYFQAAVHVDRLLSAQSILSKALEPTTELYLEFLKFALPIFTDLNKEMQSETPKLYLLYDKILTAYTTILECFVQAEYLNLTEEEKNEAQNILHAKETKILNLDFLSEQKHLPMQQIYVGGMVPNLIRRKREIGELEEEQLKNFYLKCKEFYIEAAKQILKRFPFDDKDRQALKCLKMLNPKAILDPEIKKKFPSIADLHYFFPKICPNNITELDREWRMLRNVDFSLDQNKTPDIIDFWKHVQKLRNGDESQTFPTLCELVKKLLCLPHSSAAVERLFSAINIMKTKLRNRISTTTIKGVLHTKSEITDCYSFEATEKHMKKFNKNMYDFKNKNECENIEDEAIENETEK